MSDNRLLLALSDLMDKKIEPLKSDMRDIKITLEHNMIPRLQNIESCYTTTYKRYQAGVNQIDAM